MKKIGHIENNPKHTIQYENHNPDDINLSDPMDKREISDLIIDSFLNEDMDSIAQFVHPEKGVPFSPYIYVEDDAVIINKEDFSDMLNDDTIYKWGIYYGKGTPIELTGQDFYDEFLDMTPYVDPDNVLINDLQDRGNILNNVAEKFPNTKIIKFRLC